MKTERRRKLMTAAGPACSKCGKGWGVWLGPDDSPCVCEVKAPRLPRTTPNKKELDAYKLRRKYNAMFRSVDDKLARRFTHEERVDIMTRVWPAVEAIATQVLQRTMDETLSAHQRSQDAKEFAPG